ncbi:MAG: methyltransferase domain-containing protein [Chloroflexota bacterium]
MIDQQIAGEMQSQPFDRYERYLAICLVAESVRRHSGKTRLSVLDVGGHQGFARCVLVDDTVVVVDLAEARTPGYVRGSGAELPFRDAAFDLVISLDTLEHVAPGRRCEFAGELHRVAAEAVALTAPFASPETLFAEGLLYEFIKSTLGADHDQLREHVALGLPDLDEYLAKTRALGAEVVALPSGNVHVWLFLMVLRHALMALPDSEGLIEMTDRFFNGRYAASDRMPPSYRHLVVSSRRKGSQWLAEVGAAYVSGPALDWPQAELLAYAQLVAQLASSRRLTDVTRQLAAVEDENRQLRQHIRALENGRIMRLLGGLRALRPGGRV